MHLVHQPEAAMPGVPHFDQPPAPIHSLVHRISLFLIVVIGTVAAATWSHGQEVDPDFPMVDGIVQASVVDGNTLYIGGNFLWVGPSTGRFVAFDSVSAARDESWPTVYGDYVVASASDGNGGWYIGGKFKSVRGVPRMNLAHILADGSVGPWNPGADGGEFGDVRAIALSGSTVYVGGNFFSAGGQVRNYLAAIDATNGLATGWIPAPDNVVSTLAVSGSTVYAGGFFTNIGGQARSALAAIDAGTGLATSWNPAISNFGAVSAMALGGSTIYFCGQFSTAGGQSRNGVAAVDLGTGLATSWDPNVVGFGPVVALLLDGSVVYVGGGFTNIGGQPRDYLAALDATTGLATSWDTDITGPFGNNEVHALAKSGATIYAAGNFTAVNGNSRRGLAAIDEATGLATSWNPDPSGDVRTVQVEDGKVFAAGYVLGLGGVARSGLAAIDITTGLPTAWNPAPNGSVEALAVSGSTVYVGGSFSNIGGQARNRLAALDAGTGLATAWNPNPNQGVRALAVDGTTVYAAGIFQVIGGELRDRIAALDATSGLATAWNPGASGASGFVSTIVKSGSTVYVGGDFTTAGGASRSRIAAIDATTGLATAWNPVASDVVQSIVVSGSTIYVGGHFGFIGGQPRNRIAALDAGTGLATAWNPNAGAINTAVRSLAISGSRVFVGGWFSTLGGQTRKLLGAVDITSGSATSWDPSATGSTFDQVYTLALGGSRVFAGGSYANVNQQPIINLASIAAADPSALAATVVSPNGGDVLPIGSHEQIEWSASGGHGVASVDLYISRTGAGGPWELIRMGVAPTGSYDWLVTGPTVASNAYLRVDARDWTASIASDQSDAAFTIAEPVVSVSEPGWTAFALDPLAPNPARGFAQLSFAVPRRAHVRIRLMDVQGRRVVTLVDGIHEPGRHAARLDTRTLRPGLYFVSLQAPGVDLQRRVVVIP